MKWIDIISSFVIMNKINVDYWCFLIQMDTLVLLAYQGHMIIQKIVNFIFCKPIRLPPPPSQKYQITVLNSIQQQHPTDMNSSQNSRMHYLYWTTANSPGLAATQNTKLCKISVCETFWIYFVAFFVSKVSNHMFSILWFSPCLLQ